MSLLTLQYSPQEIQHKTRRIQDQLLHPAGLLDGPNFTQIDTVVLRRMYELYDREFFGGEIARLIESRSPWPLRLRLSRTMTASGGKTIHYRRRVPGPRGAAPTIASEYEIAVAVRLLFDTFSDIDRPVVIGGLSCATRIEALQRIMEHEIIHLAESLTTGRTNCSAGPYKTLARRIFGHTDTTHGLVTPREHAAVHHNVRIGTRVRFDFDTRTLEGVVNRIHQRATVLVESPTGQPYLDGKLYLKYYVPLAALKVLSPLPA